MFDVETIAVAESGVTQALKQREKAVAAFYEQAQHVFASLSPNDGREEGTDRTVREAGDTRRRLATELNARYGGELDAAEREMKLLAMRRDRLHAFADWSKEDPGLIQALDAVLVNQGKASRRRQRRFTWALTVAALIIGWLLSAITPTSATVLTRLFGH